MGIGIQHSTCETDDVAAIRADDLVVRYGNVTALAASSFALAGGSSTALIGANGSGKTTLLHVLAGLVQPSAGRVDVAASERTAIVAQQHHQHRWMPLTVHEVVRMGRYRRAGLVGRLRSDDRQAIAAGVERADIGDLLRRPYGELSGGQQQRVRIAQALASEPDLLLLDEPITGLDPPSQERILEIIATECERGTTVVFSTHHLEEAQRADEVLVLDGKVLACGPPEETLRAEVLTEAFGGRMLVIGRPGRSQTSTEPDDTGEAVGELLFVDDHGHGHGHGHEHDHGEHRDHDSPAHRDDVHGRWGSGRDHVPAGTDAIRRDE